MKVHLLQSTRGHVVFKFLSKYLPTNKLLSYRMVSDELYELSGQDPGLPPGIQADVVRRWLVKAQPPQLHRVLVVCLLHNSGCFPLIWHGERAGVSLALPLTEDVDELQVGGEHHLGPGHVEGVGPVPAVGQQVPHTDEFSLDDGEMSPVDVVGHGGGVDVGPRVPRPVALQHVGHGGSEQGGGLVVNMDTVAVLGTEDCGQTQLQVTGVTGEHRILNEINKVKTVKDYVSLIIALY